MKYMHKAIWQADGNLVVRGNTRALLFRALADARAELAVHEGANPQAARTLQSLQEVLGAFDGPLPARWNCSATRPASSWRATCSRAESGPQRAAPCGMSRAAPLSGPGRLRLPHR